MSRTLRELASIMDAFEKVAEVQRPTASGRGRRVWVVAQMRAFLEQWQREARDDLTIFVSTTRAALAERAVVFEDDLLSPGEYAASKKADDRKYASWTNSIANVLYKEWHTTGLIIAKL
jgi:hypothetical protein